MYPADDILVRVREATEHARALKASVDAHVARVRALQERALSRPRPGTGLIEDIGEAVRASRALLEEARQHRRRCQLLVEQPRRRRSGIAGERD